MKTYNETQEGSIVDTVTGGTIPPGHRFYKAALAEVEAGTSEIIPFDHAAKAIADEVSAERRWRNLELARADVELYKVQDGEGTGSVTDWRDYRSALRDLPDHADFPGASARPTSPDA